MLEEKKEDTYEGQGCGIRFFPFHPRYVEKNGIIGFPQSSFFGFLSLLTDYMSIQMVRR